MKNRFLVQVQYRNANPNKKWSDWDSYMSLKQAEIEWARLKRRSDISAVRIMDKEKK